MRNDIKTFTKIESNILKSIPNPSNRRYEIKIKIPECTFLGVKKQPDFATLYISFFPRKKVIELKSLKEYIYQLRYIVISYERLINIVYDNLMDVYEPERLIIKMICYPRGGISSKLIIDSKYI